MRKWKCDVAPLRSRMRPGRPGGRRPAWNVSVPGIGRAAAALACAATLGLSAAHAQGGPAHEPTPLPALAYDTYFEPFTDNPVYRLHNPEPFQPAQPLFTKFDPLEGLTREAKVSRVASVGDRVIVYMPIMRANVGQTVSVPVGIQNAPPVTGIRIILENDRSRLTPTDVRGAGIPTEDADMNIHPDPSAVDNCSDCLIALNAFAHSWSKGGTMFSIQFRASEPGDVPLNGRYAEVSDEAYNLLPVVVHDGLVRINE